MTRAKHLFATTVFAFLASAANAAPEQLVIERGMDHTVHAAGLGWSDLAGVATYVASPNVVTAVNVISVVGSPYPASLQAVSPAELEAPIAISASGRGRYASLASVAPLTQLSVVQEGDQLTVQSLQSAGGFRVTTTKNGATNGSGSLTISDLKVDLQTKIIYADIVGANGVGVLNDHALWTYDSVAGPVTFKPGFDKPFDATLSPPPLTFSGLFLAKASDIDDIFVAALNLNNIGRVTFTAANNRSATNPLGFGSITISAVPEPGAWASMVAGMAALLVLGRRGAKR